MSFENLTLKGNIGGFQPNILVCSDVWNMPQDNLLHKDFSTNYLSYSSYAAYVNNESNTPIYLGFYGLSEGILGAKTTDLLGCVFCPPNATSHSERIRNIFRYAKNDDIPSLRVVLYAINSNTTTGEVHFELKMDGAEPIRQNILPYVAFFHYKDNEGITGTKIKAVCNDGMECDAVTKDGFAYLKGLKGGYTEFVVNDTTTIYKNVLGGESIISLIEEEKEKEGCIDGSIQYEGINPIDFDGEIKIYKNDSLFTTIPVNAGSIKNTTIKAGYYNAVIKSSLGNETQYRDIQIKPSDIHTININDFPIIKTRVLVRFYSSIEKPDFTSYNYSGQKVVLCWYENGQKKSAETYTVPPDLYINVIPIKNAPRCYFVMQIDEKEYQTRDNLIRDNANFSLEIKASNINCTAKYNGSLVKAFYVLKDKSGEIIFSKDADSTGITFDVVSSSFRGEYYIDCTIATPEIITVTETVKIKAESTVDVVFELLKGSVKNGKI